MIDHLDDCCQEILVITAPRQHHATRPTINVRSNLTNIPINNFPDSLNPEFNDQSMTNQINQHSIPHIPTVLSANVRAIATKVDEIQQVAELNSVDIICITETWLSPSIPDFNVSIPGYNLFCHDRAQTTCWWCMCLFGRKIAK